MRIKCLGMEIWKDIKGYEGLYQVSNQGRVRSLNYLKTGKTVVMKPVNNGVNYFSVLLTKNGKQEKNYIHRLVAEAFLENPFNLPEVNHKDENPSNNVVDNLEWCSHKYNLNYGTCKERMISKLTGRTNTKHSVPVLQYSKTGEFIREFPSMMEAERSGFKCSNICKCCSGERKSHGGYIWRYKEKKEVS